MTIPSVPSVPSIGLPGAGVSGAAAAGPAVSEYQTAVMALNPSLYWRLGEPSGTVANDETANNLDGTYVNAPTLGVTGLLVGDANTAAQFASASTQQVTLGSVPTAATDNWAIAAWASLTALTSNVGHIAYNGVGGTNGYGFGMGNGTGGNGVKLQGHVAGTFLNTSYTFVDANTHFFVMTREAGTIKFYVDGAVLASTFATVPVAPATAFRVAGPTGAGSGHWNGVIDEVAVFATALTAANVADLYAAGT